MTTLPPFEVSLDTTESDRIERAAARIRRYCRWHIWPSITETVTLDSDGGRILQLRSLLVTAVGSVTDNVAAETVDPGDYSWSSSGMLAARCGVWPRGFRAVTVTFTHGYAAPQDDLIEVLVAVASREPARRLNVAQESADGISRTYAGAAGAAAAGFTADEQAVLDELRIALAP